MESKRGAVVKVKFVILLAVIVVLSSFAYSDIPPPPPVPSFGGSPGGGSGGVQDVPPSVQPRANASNASTASSNDFPTSPPPPSGMRSEDAPSSPQQAVESPPRQEASPASAAEGQVSGVSALSSRVARLELLLFVSLFLNVVAVVLFVVILFALRSKNAGKSLKEDPDYVRIVAIRSYVRRYMDQGYSLDSIKKYLLSQGYDGRLVERALQDGV